MNGPMFDRRPARVLYYSHDTYGLGHLRRTLALAESLDRRLPGLRQQIVTGSPVATDVARRSRAELVCLPPVVKVGPDRYAPREPGPTLEALLEQRARRLLTAARRFQPDLVVIDHAPLGLQGEALPLLRWLRRQPGSRTMLGLRDVVDTPRKIRAQWRAAGVYADIERYYDRVLVYGDRRVYDTARAYAIPSATRRRLRHIGYLGRVHPARNVELARRSEAERRVLVTAGGGGDGMPVFEAALGLAESGRYGDALRLHLVLGPLLDPAERIEIHARAASLPMVELTDFAPAMAPLWARADAVITMGGYNTLTEVVAHRLPAVVVPRVRPRREQWIRARAFEQRLGGRLEVISPDHLSPASLAGAIDVLPAKRGARPPMDLRGLHRFADEAAWLIAQARLPQRAGERARFALARS